MPKILNYRSIPVKLTEPVELNLTRFYHDHEQLGTPVFMLHSIMQNGTTYFSDEGKGLACYLARQGFDVYVADLRGKGKSKPVLAKNVDYGCHEVINEDIPAMLAKIVEIRGNVPQIWVGHGWGSALLSGYYARYENNAADVKGIAHFGAVRKMHLNTRRKRLLHGAVWRHIRTLMAKKLTYVPTGFLRLGSDNEAHELYEDFLASSVSDPWLDRKDGYNYTNAIRERVYPPGFYTAAKGDLTYGDIDDVRAFVKSLGVHDARLVVLSKTGGNLHDYNHMDILQHSDCERDHFPTLLSWLLGLQGPR